MRSTLLTGVALLVFVGGSITGFQFTKDPVCNCPEVIIPPCPSAISIQELDMQSIKKIKGNFTYSPAFEAENIYLINNSDTTKLK